MDPIVRMLSDKESNNGEIIDTTFEGEITTAASTGRSEPAVVVVGELSSDNTNIVNTTQLSLSLPARSNHPHPCQHRTVSGMSNIEDDDTIDHPNELRTGGANVVMADEELPIESCNPDDNEEDDDEDDYEYEDDDYAAFSSFIVNSEPIVVPIPIINSTNNTSDTNATKPAKIEEEVTTESTAVESSELPNSSSQPINSDNVITKKSKWRQPSTEAVNMSLRAEKETCGMKRRLALDLYRIMNQETEEAGFTLCPKHDDSMDSWTIKLFQFDEDSKLAQDMLVLNVPYIELEMNFPNQYPFEPPFVHVTQPRFRKQTGFVMNGALCMELLTKDGWNPVCDIESVIVSIRSMLVVGDGRLEAACALPETKYASLLEAATQKRMLSSTTSDETEHEHDTSDDINPSPTKRQKSCIDDNQNNTNATLVAKKPILPQGGSYSVSEAQAAYSHLSDYHKKKGWDTSGWWSRKG